MRWGLSTLKRSSGISQSVSAGLIIWRRTRQWNRSGLSAITKRRQNIPLSCWRGRRQIVERDAALVPRPVLNPNRRANESEGFSQLVLEKSLVGKMQLHFAVGEKHERRRGHSRLRHVIDFHLLACGHRSALEIDILQEAVHLGSRNSFPPLGRDFF